MQSKLMQGWEKMNDHRAQTWRGRRQGQSMKQTFNSGGRRENGGQA